MTTLKWARRSAYTEDGYFADGDEHRYTVYRYNSRWLLQVRPLRTTVAGVRVASQHVIDYSQNDTMTLCKAVAQAYENLERNDGARMRRATAASYDTMKEPS